MSGNLEDKLKEHQIPVEEFYNYYSVPWTKDYYVKFPTSMLVIMHDSNNIYFASSFKDSEYTDTDDSENTFETNRSLFMKRHYLGSARDTDIYRIKKLVGDRIEL